MAYHRHFPRNKIPVSVTLEAWLLCASIAATVLLIQTDVIATLLAQVEDYHALASFASGTLFSSGILTPPAIVAILESAQYVPAWKLTLFGSIGAVAGDILLFRFMRSRLLEYFLQAMLHPRVVKMARAIAAGPFWWLGPITGAIVIASPLPDELGLLMMGLSSIGLVPFISLAFVANAAGIYLMILVAQRFA